MSLGATLLVATHLALADTVPPVMYEVDGVKVIHQGRDSTSTVIAVQLHLLGGARQVTSQNAGVEPFVLMASEYGSRNYPGEAARRALARTGSDIHVSAETDWTAYAFRGIKQEFDSAWAVFADRLMHPTLDSTAIAIVRARMLADVARRRTSPERHVVSLADSLAFAGHAYAVNPSGTEQSIRSLTADDLRNYARDQFTTSRMLLVVVGDISRDRLERAISRTLGKLPRGNYVWSLPPPPPPSKTAVAAVQRNLQTNYIVGYMHGPARSSEDFPAFERAMGLLGNWINYVVREKEALSYAASVDVVDRGVPGAAIFMSTTRPDSAMKLVNMVLKEAGSNVTIPRATLRKAARAFNTSYLFAKETAASHAELLARAQLYDGDFRAAGRRAEIMGKIAFPDLRAAIRTYTKNIQFAYVGDTTRLPRAEFTKR